MSGLHRDESYHPVKTRTLLLWFFALLATIVTGMTVGDKISVYAQPFIPFPIFHAPEVREWLDGGFPDEGFEEPATTPAPADSEPEPVISSSPSAAPTTAVVAPEPTRSAPSTTPPVRTAIVVVPPDIPAVSTPVPPVAVAPVPPVALIQVPIISEPEPLVEVPVLTTPEPVVEEPVVEPVVTEETPTPTPEETVP